MIVTVIIVVMMMVMMVMMLMMVVTVMVTVMMRMMVMMMMMMIMMVTTTMRMIVLVIMIVAVTVTVSVMMMATVTMMIVTEAPVSEITQDRAAFHEVMAGTTRAGKNPQRLSLTSRSAPANHRRQKMGQTPTRKTWKTKPRWPCQRQTTTSEWSWSTPQHWLHICVTPVGQWDPRCSQAAVAAAIFGCHFGQGLMAYSSEHHP